MTTPSKIFCIITFSVCFSLQAQSVAFENINSDNVLNMLSLSSLNQEAEISSSVSVVQVGNYNYSEIDINRNSEISLMQSGNFNYFNFDNSFEKDGSQNTITAEGNNNIIDVVGSNSISEKMQIHVKGDNRTIFVRNY